MADASPGQFGIVGVLGFFMASPNHCMQPTPQTVIKFAYANLPPVWRAADAGC